MKKLDVQYAVDPVRQPILARTMLHIQEAYAEIVNALFLGLYTYTPGDIVIIRGCQISGTNPGPITMTDGAIYYQGEIYLVPAASFTTTGSQIPLWTISTTYRNGDPITFTDASTHYVHEVIQFVLVPGLSGGPGIPGYVVDYNDPSIKPFSPSRHDRQHDYASGLTTSVPTSGIQSQIGATLTTAPGLNRDYKLEFTWVFNKLTVDSEMFMAFYKNGTTLLQSFHHVAIPVSGQSQTATIHFMDLNVAPGNDYSVKVSTGSSSQYELQAYHFSIDGIG